MAVAPRRIWAPVPWQFQASMLVGPTYIGYSFARTGFFPLARCRRSPRQAVRDGGISSTKNEGLIEGLRCVPWRFLQMLRCHTCACKSFYVSFPSTIMKDRSCQMCDQPEMNSRILLAPRCPALFVSLRNLFLGCRTHASFGLENLSGRRTRAATSSDAASLQSGYCLVNTFSLGL